MTRVLLDRFAIGKRPYAYHEYNANEVGPKLIAAFAQGKSVALVSDAGTPLVSDPGYRLVKEALAAGLPGHTLPGPSSVVTALSASGLPNDSFFSPASCHRRRSPGATAWMSWRKSRHADLLRIPAPLAIEPG